MDKAGVGVKRSNSSKRKAGDGQRTLLWDLLLTFSYPGSPSTYPCHISEAIQYLHSCLPLGQAQPPNAANLTASLAGASWTPGHSLLSWTSPLREPCWGDCDLLCQLWVWAKLPAASVHALSSVQCFPWTKVVAADACYTWCPFRGLFWAKKHWICSQYCLVGTSPLCPERKPYWPLGLLFTEVSLTGEECWFPVPFCRRL